MTFGMAKPGLFSAFLAALVGSGCATITQGTTELLVVESTPPGARVGIEPGNHVLITPGSIELHRGTRYVLSFELDGYEKRIERVVPQAGGATAGNLLVGGIVGMAADRDSGAAYALFPNPVQVRLLRPRESAEFQSARARIVFINTTNPKLFDGGEIAIRMDGQLVGTFGSHGKIEIDVDPGPHRLHLQHRDVWLFDDEYDLVVDEGETRIEVFSRPVSTKFKVLDTRPAADGPRADEPAEARE